MCIRDSDDAILRNGKKDVQQLALGGKALAASGGAEDQPVGVFQPLAVAKYHVV